ncbi:nucleoside phosphorylase domain-containing protein [Aspergillus varians]
MFNPHDYTVGWVCALIIEYVAAQAVLDEQHAEPEDGSLNDINTYTLGRIGKHNVVIAILPQGDYGIASAAATARDMLRSFPNVRIGLTVGIGGGAPTPQNDIRLGDVVVGSSVIQYDAGKEVQGEEFEITRQSDQPPMVIRTAVGALEARYMMRGHQIHADVQKALDRNPRIKSEFGRPELETDRLFKLDITHALNCADFCCVDPSKLVPRAARSNRLDDPIVHYGVVASASRVMKNAIARDKLARERDVLCFEMEAAGLMNHFPCVVIRGICDYADSHKDDDWQGYAAMTAAAYTKDLLNQISPTRVEAERTIIDIISEVSESVSRTETCVELIRTKLQRNEDREILEWLSSEDYSAQQRDCIMEREAGTGQWVFDAPEFKDWVQDKGQILFCPGIPGAGKTVITSTVIDYVERKFKQDSDIRLAYVYFNYKRHGAQKLRDVMASLLKQLLEDQPHLCDRVRDLYHKHRPVNSRPSSDELMQVTQGLLASYSRVFFVIDALDECQTADTCRDMFVSALFNLQAAYNVNILVTSREIPDITEQFAGSPRLEIRARREDIEMYIDGRIAKSMQPLLSTHRDMIKDKITRVVEGRFLLAQLHYDTISTKRTLRQIKDTLRSLSTGPRAYDQVYDEAMSRISGSGDMCAKIGMKVLMGITRASRPLSTEEMQNSLAPVLGDCTPDEKGILEIDDMISACSGLVAVDGERSIIRLVHYTTHEYLQRTQEAWFPSPETIITETNFTYLSFEVPGNGQ